MRVTCFATQGPASLDEVRIRSLLADLHPTVYAFDRGARVRSALRLVARLRRERPNLVVMEGTGLGGGLALLAARAVVGTRYVVSTGDAVGPFMEGRRRGLGVPFGVYERALLRFSAGVVGWSPYLTGRALTFGAPRAVTAPGWAAADTVPLSEKLRDVAKQRLGLHPEALVFGMAGSLGWNRRYGYCYGLELVHALRATTRADVQVLVVGGGDGLDALRREGAGDPRLVLTGPVPREAVPEALAAMDVASLPQSVDRVGSFRYTTKLSEYLAAGLPVVTGQIPVAYDLDEGWLWRLPGDAPWEEQYLAALASLMETISRDDIEQRRQQVTRPLELFDEDRQRRRVTAFLTEIVSASSTR